MLDVYAKNVQLHSESQYNYFLVLIDKSTTTTPLTSFYTTAKYLDIGPCCYVVVAALLSKV